MLVPTAGSTLAARNNATAQLFRSCVVVNDGRVRCIIVRRTFLTKFDDLVIIVYFYSGHPTIESIDTLVCSRHPFDQQLPRSPKSAPSEWEPW
jgi:hypothetical protein